MAKTTRLQQAAQAAAPERPAQPLALGCQAVVVVVVAAIQPAQAARAVPADCMVAVAGVAAAPMRALTPARAGPGRTVS